MANQEIKGQSTYMPLNSRKRRKNRKVIAVIAILAVLSIVVIKKESIYTGLVNVAKNIPGLENMFEEVSNTYMDLSKEDLIKKIEQLEDEINLLNNALETSAQEKTVLMDKIDALKVYEDRYTEFIEQKKAWDINIANSNTDLFIEQFELMYEENANVIYKELKQKQVLTKEQKNYSKMIGEMDEERAAKALETVAQTDPELVRIIFDGMEKERQALILSAMNTQTAAQSIKILSPDVEINLP